MDEKRTTDTGKEGETSKQGQGQGGTQGSDWKKKDAGQGIQSGRGESQANDWNKEPGKGTPESES
jgi:hypothetical protein